MARKSRQTNGEVLLELAALLPWWLALILAVVAYGVLHHLATGTEVAPTNSAQLGTYLNHTFGRVLATYGQFVVPLILIIGAFISFMRSARNEKRFDDTKALGKKSALLSMSWQDFEELIGEYFRRLGYSVQVTGQGGPDGGIDAVLTKGTETFLVQCKQWRAHKVGVDVVRQLYGVMAARGAVGGFVVSAGDFTAEAAEFAAGRNITLLDGERLIASMKNIARPEKAAPVSAPQLPSALPTCPRCNSSMVKRVAKQGPRAGQSFWGCATYPKCGGIRPI